MRLGKTIRGIHPRPLIATAAVVFAAFITLLALGVISPLGVQGADQPAIAGDGQGVGFQRSSMVTNVTVTNTPNEPGEAAQYAVTFVTGEVLQANVDTIVFDIDSSVWVPVSIPADAIRISASAVTGGGQANQSIALSEDPNWEYGFEGRDIYTITVPDMDATESSGMENIDAGARVTVTFLISAGLINPTESGSYDFTISTSKEAAGVKATFTTPLTLSISNKSGNRDTPITLVGRGFKKGTTVTVYLDRTRDANGRIVNMPDGVRIPGTDVDLETAGVDSDGTFTVNNAARVPPFAPVAANQINAIDDGNPPKHYNGMDGQTPVTFTIEPLLYVSSSLVALGGEVELILVDWPATDQVMDHVTSDAQGAERVVRSAVTIAGIPQEIISGEGPVGPDHEHAFLVRVGATVPAGIHELSVRTYTADQMMSDVPGGASDAKNIKIWDRFCPLDPAQTPGSVAGDRAALIALYNATDGANWTDNTNWLTNAPIFQWYGVSADAEGRVCALNLHGNGLSGEIPEELGGLTNLTGLYLNDNQLSGEIPEGLGRLTNVQRLFLSGNRLTGDIPEELGGLTNLTGLYLDDNQLSGEIPPELGGLTNLTGLYLDDNQLSGEIPPELGRLTNLTELHLSYNQLSGEIPPELGGLTNLTGLFLNDNELSGEIPPELGGLTNLTGLYLDDNQLSGEIPEGLGSLTNLTGLHLYANQLSGEMPAELGSLTSLEALFLSHNQLSGEIPAELGNLTNLRSLHINDNQLSGEIPTELGNLTNLVSLILHANQLNEEIPAELGNLTNLRSLHINDNQLSGDVPKELGNLANLRSVYLSNNRLTGCVPASLWSVANNDFAELGLPFCDKSGPGSVSDRAALVALYNATEGANWRANSGWLTDAPLSQWYGVETSSTGRVTGLVLRLNKLNGVIPAELGNLTSLVELDFWGNRLSGKIPAELGGLANLTHLSLMSNRLRGEIPPELSSLTNLTELNLSINHLNGEIPEELGSLPNLAILGLDSNRLSGDIPADLGSLPSLAVLHLHNNRLSGEMPGELGNLMNLTELDFSGNPISGEIPAELGNLTNLRSLRFKGNQLSGEIPAKLGGMTSLEALFLSHNRLSGEIPAELGNLTNLLGLYLNDNQLSGEIPAELGSLANLQWLDLAFNQLSGEIPKELGSLANLAGLFLNDNQLSGGMPDELGNLTNLEILRLSSNRLTGCVLPSLRSAASHDLAELSLPFCDMLEGSPVVVVRFVSKAGAPVRLGFPVSLEAAFSEAVNGFSLKDISVANGVASIFSGSGSVYNFDVTPNAIGEVAVDVPAGVAEDADGNGNIAARLSLGIPYDDDGDGMISRSEVIAAISDYLEEIITREQVIAVIRLYLSG